MFITRFIERHVGILLTLALIAGVALPQYGEILKGMLPPILITILTIAFLGVDVGLILEELRRPLRLLVLLFSFSVLIPIATYVLIVHLDESFAIPALLLASMPAGVSSSVFTSLARGRVETSAVITVFTHIIAPLTVPTILFALTGTRVEINVLGMAKQLTILIALPMLIAWSLRTFLGGIVRSTKPYHKSLSVISVCALGFTAICPHALEIRNNPGAIIVPTMELFLLFAVLYAVGILIARRRVREEKIAIAISRTYMNYALAIVLAQQFLPAFALTTVLSVIPWITTFGIVLWVNERLFPKTA